MLVFEIGLVGGVGGRISFSLSAILIFSNQSPLDEKFRWVLFRLFLFFVCVLFIYMCPGACSFFSEGLAHNLYAVSLYIFISCIDEFDISASQLLFLYNKIGVRCGSMRRSFGVPRVFIG